MSVIKVLLMIQRSTKSHISTTDGNCNSRINTSRNKVEYISECKNFFANRSYSLKSYLDSLKEAKSTWTRWIHLIPSTVIGGTGEEILRK